MLDKDGYRPNVGIILVNGRNEVFWGKRIREHSWQFPQGGIKRGETPEQAMFRELEEETGLKPEHVRIIGRTRNWLRYDVPEHWVRREWRGHYRGQKQIWFLLRMVGKDTDVRLRASDHPEFDAWRWNEYWVPLESVIEFKRGVYQQALTELSRFLSHRRRPDAPRYLRKRRDGDGRDRAAGGREGEAQPGQAARGGEEASVPGDAGGREANGREAVAPRGHEHAPHESDRGRPEAPTVELVLTIERRVTVTVDAVTVDAQVAVPDAVPLDDAPRVAPERCPQAGPER